MKKEKCQFNTYNIGELLEDLRNQIQIILPKEQLLYGCKLTDIKLSYYLNQNDNHIYCIKKKLKRNPKYQISFKILRSYRKGLIQNFEKNYENLLKHLDKYENENELKEENKKIYEYHPNIILDYFKIIDSKEKAYWLGFIYADGNLSFKTPKKRYIRFYFGLSIKDTESHEVVHRLANLLGINHKNIKPDSRGVLLGFSVTNNIFCNYLKQHGVIIGKKSKIIELPNLSSRDLYLAFLLGYYDGDGYEGSTIICSGSKTFLKQVKAMFEINFELKYKKKKSVINGREFKGEGWTLALGAELMNEIMRNYNNSLPRKRKIFETEIEKSKRMIRMNKARAKLKITQNFLEDLNKLVWKMPLYQIAEMYKISTSRISTICKQYKIEKPTIGYWRKKNKKTGK